MKKIFLFFAITAFCMAFSGCTVFETDTEALMKPPVFTEEQEKLNSALTEVIGESYTLKYPANGDMNSAFIFEDLDGDGEEEALAFYSLLDESTRINILKKEGEGWVSVYEAAGFYGDIERIDFAEMDYRGKVLIVKWDQETAAYLYSGERLITLYRAACDRLDITDINGDGYSELLVFGSNLAGRNVLNVVHSTGDDIVVSGDITTEYTNIFSAEEGKLHSGMNAYFMDSFISVSGGVVYLTEIITLEEGTAKKYYIADFVEYEINEEPDDSDVIVVVGGDYGKRGIFLRNTKVHCMDTNGDGITEMPVEIRYDSGDGKENFFIQFMQYNGEFSVPVWNGVANTENGCLFAVPESWNEKVSVDISSSGDETIFTDMSTGKELMRIFAVLKSDYQDKYEEYTLCAEDETKNYYVSSSVPKEYFMDTNGDGIAEIPAEVCSSNISGETDSVFFVQNMQFEGTLSVSVSGGVLNTKKGYLFILPESWNDKADIAVASSGERIVLNDTETGDELLRLVAVSKTERQDKYSEYTLCAENETSYYYVKSSVSPESELYLAPEYFENCLIFK